MIQPAAHQFLMHHAVSDLCLHDGSDQDLAVDAQLATRRAKYRISLPRAGAKPVFKFWTRRPIIMLLEKVISMKKPTHSGESKEPALQPLESWPKEITPESWKAAQAEQDEEERMNASPIPVVFPVGD